MNKIDKMAQWLKATSPANPRYKSRAELGPDEVTTICKMKSEGALMRHITHAVSCSLQTAYDVLNLDYGNYLVGIRGEPDNYSTTLEYFTGTGEEQPR